MRDVGLLVGECGFEIARCRARTIAAGLREVHPLVRVDAQRVGAVEPGEQRLRRGTVAAAPPVGAVDVEPDTARLADVGDRVERVDRSGQRRAGRRDDGDRDDARGDVFVDRRRERLRSRAVGGRRSAAAGRSRRRFRAARRPASPSSAPPPRRTARHAAPRGPSREPGQRALARRGERGDVRHRAAAREGARARGEAEELRRPLDGLLLDLGVAAAAQRREVDVEAGASMSPTTPISAAPTSR